MYENEYLKLLKYRESFLDNEIVRRKKRLEKAPSEKLRIGRKDKFFQYYIRKNGEKSGIYIKKADMDTILLLAQKKYDEAFVTQSEPELKMIQKILKVYSSKKQELSSVFPWEIKSKMDIAEWSDEDYAERWQNIPFVPKKIGKDVPFHVTARGEQVRSKSEEMIANALYSRGIPYKYECPLKIYSGDIRYPDFTILNPYTRKVVFLEHLGKMDDPNYVEMNLQRIRDYEKTGIFLGKELLITMETQKMPLNTKQIDDFISKHFGKS